MTGDGLGWPHATPQPPPTATQLTLDQAYQQLFAGSPDNLYQQAELVDATAASLQDHLDKFANQLRNMEEVWSGAGADSYGETAGKLSDYIRGLLWALHNPNYAALLRQAGDALAFAQQRIADLKTQRDKGVAANPADAASDQVRHDYLAAQVMQSVSDSYVLVGEQIAGLPAYTAMGNPISLSTWAPPPNPNYVVAGPAISTPPAWAVAMPTAALGKPSGGVSTGMFWMPASTGGAGPGPTPVVPTAFEGTALGAPSLGHTELPPTAVRPTALGPTAVGSTSLAPTSTSPASSHSEEAVAGYGWLVSGVVGAPKPVVLAQKSTAGTSDTSKQKPDGKSAIRYDVKDPAIPSDGVLRADNSALVADCGSPSVNAVPDAPVAHTAVAHPAMTHSAVVQTTSAGTPTVGDVSVSNSTGTITPQVTAHATATIPTTPATPTSTPVSTTSQVGSHATADIAPHDTGHVDTQATAEARGYAGSPAPSSSSNTLAPTTVTSVQSPVTPTENPVTPAQNPVTPAQNPVTPAQNPVTPAETALTARQGAVMPAETALTARQGGLMPAETALTPQQSALMPAQNPMTPMAPGPGLTGPMTPVQNPITPVTPGQNPITPNEFSEPRSAEPLVGHGERLVTPLAGAPTPAPATPNEFSEPRLGETPVVGHVEQSVSLPAGAPTPAPAPRAHLSHFSATSMSHVDNSAVGPVGGNQGAPGGSSGAGALGRSMAPMQLGGSPTMVPDAGSRFEPADPGPWHVDDVAPSAVGRQPQFTPEEVRKDD